MMPSRPSTPQPGAELVVLQEELERVKRQHRELQEKLLASETAAAEAKAAQGLAEEEATAAKQKSIQAESEVAALTSQVVEAQGESSRARANLQAAQAALDALQQQQELHQQPRLELVEPQSETELAALQLAVSEATAVEAMAAPQAGGSPDAPGILSPTCEEDPGDPEAQVSQLKAQLAGARAAMEALGKMASSVDETLGAIKVR